MAETDVGDVRGMLAEMATMLNDIQCGTNDLLKSYSSSSVKSTCQLSNRASAGSKSSSWARSNAPRISFLNKKLENTNYPDNYNALFSEKCIKVKNPSYTIPKAKNLESNFDRKAIDVDFYDTNIDALSTKKRSRSLKIASVSDLSNTKKSTLTSQTPTIQLDHPKKLDNSSTTTTSESTPNTSESNDPKKKRNSIEHHNYKSESHAYSFGKASRPILVKNNPAYEYNNTPTVLDIERGENYLKNKPPSVVILPEAKTIPLQPTSTTKMNSHQLINANSTETQHLKNSTTNELDNAYSITSGSTTTTTTPKLTSQPKTKPEKPFDPPIDIILSHRERTPNITFHPDKTVHSKRFPEKCPPGPGAYTVAVNNWISTEPQKGVIYREDKPMTAAEKAAALSRVDKALPGPGDYDISKADTIVNTSTPSVSMRKPEPKPTAHLERRKYWEDKARTAREENDDLQDVNDMVVRERVSVVTIRPDVKTGIDYRNRQVLRDREAERDRIAQLSYNISYSVVEKQPEVLVHMSREVAVQQSLQKQRAEKPSLAKLAADREREKAARDAFLGPQLPVAWALPQPEDTREQKSTSKRRNNNHNAVGDANGEGDEGYLSPSEEVLQLLLEREVARGEYTHEKDFQDTAHAYLTSSLSGNISRHTTVRMKPPKPSDSRAGGDPPPPESSNFEFLAPQLPIDWVAESHSRSQKHKIPATRLDIRTGRESIEIKRKGEVHKQFFEDPIVMPTSLDKADNATGDASLTTTNYPTFGMDAKGGVLPFQLHVGRGDAVGPRGERPKSAVESERVFREEYWGELELAPEAAKDSEAMRQEVVRSVPLYLHEKHLPEKKPDEAYVNHIGGSYFEGMFEEISKSSNPTLQLDKMTGRDDLKTEEHKQLLLQEGFTTDEQVDLNIKDFKPHKPEIKAALIFTDSKKDPKFITPKSNGLLASAPPLSPKYNLLERKTDVVNISKQFGREDIGNNKSKNNIDELQLEEEHIWELAGLGWGDQGMAEELDFIQSNNINIAKNKKFKQGNVVIDMKLQNGRQRDINEKSDGEHLVPYDVNLSITKERTGRGVLEWNKQTSTPNIVEVELAMGELKLGLEKEEVVTSPKPFVLSKYTRDPEAKDWSVAASVPRFPVPQEPLSHQLEYDTSAATTVTSDKERVKSVVNMSTQILPRKDVELEKKYLQDEVDVSSEELILSPKYYSKSGVNTTNSMPNWSKQTTKGEADALVNNQLDILAYEEIIIDPDKSVTQPATPKGVLMSKQSNLRKGVEARKDEQQLLQRLHVIEESEELQLSPRAATGATNPIPAWNKQVTVSEYNHFKGDSILDVPGELILEPDATVTRRNTATGTVPLSKQTVSRSSRADAKKAEQQLLVASRTIDQPEELMLFPPADLIKRKPYVAGSSTTGNNAIPAESAGSSNASGAIGKANLPLSEAENGITQKIDNNKGQKTVRFASPRHPDPSRQTASNNNSANNSTKCEIGTTATNKPKLSKNSETPEDGKSLASTTKKGQVTSTSTDSNLANKGSTKTNNRNNKTIPNKVIDKSIASNPYAKKESNTPLKQRNVSTVNTASAVTPPAARAPPPQPRPPPVKSLASDRNDYFDL